MKPLPDVITKLFVATDQRDWSAVEACFAPTVTLDYSSMNGNPAVELTPDDVTGSWKTILPGFDHTHHQLGNFLTTTGQREGHVFCYGTATHYLGDSQGNIWTVVGSYDFDLAKDDKDEWKITRMVFNFKYQSGNTSLPEKAAARAQG